MSAENDNRTYKDNHQIMLQQIVLNEHERKIQGERFKTNPKKSFLYFKSFGNTNHI